MSVHYDIIVILGAKTKNNFFLFVFALMNLRLYKSIGTPYVIQYNIAY